MQFETARDMFDHLAQFIDDEDMIARAVRQKFPTFRKRQPGTTTPAKMPEGAGATMMEGAWTSRDQAYRKSMEYGSKQLLIALIAELKAIDNRNRQRIG